MSNAELVEWAAMYVVEPFGQVREDLRAGRIAATVANAVPRARGSRLFEAEDFFPELRTGAPARPPMQSKEEQLANLKTWAIMNGAAVPAGDQEGPQKVANNG